MLRVAFHNSHSFYRLMVLNQHYWLVQKVILLIVLLSNGFVVSAQNIAHPSFRQYTTNDGLPSSEVYHILQDKKGYIWIATDNGMSRFDGYEFHNYSVKDGLVENVIFMMQLDSLDRVWMQAMSGRLYYYDQDTILPYRNNNVIDSFITQTHNKGFIVEGKGEVVHFSAFSVGIVSSSNDGTPTFQRRTEPISKEVFERKGITIISISQKGSNEETTAYVENLYRINRSESFYLSSAQRNWELHELVFTENENAYNFEAFCLGQEIYLIKSLSEVYFIENGKVIWQNHFAEDIRYVRLMNNGQLFVGLGFQKGLRIYNSLDAFRRKEGTTWMSGETVSYIMEGKDGVIWLATNENGIFYIPSNALAVYDKASGLPDDNIKSITLKNENELYLGLNNGEVWELNYADGRLNKLPEIPYLFSYVRDLYLDRKNQTLWAGKGDLHYYQDDKWKTINDPFVNSTSATKRSILGGRITQSPKNKKIWIGHHAGFSSINIPENLPDSTTGNNSRTYIVREDYEGRVWVGQANGLFEWKEGTLYRQDGLNPLFARRIEDIALMPDSTLVIATKGGGLVFWKGDEFEQVSTSEGLTSDMLECVYADESGVVWAGTLNGLNRISGAFDNRKVEQITIFNGLPSNEINRICKEGDNVWVATNRGLVHFIDKNVPHASPKPILSSVTANNELWELSKPVKLPYQKNNLTIDFYAINYRMNGQIPYRYRMENNEWSYTSNLSLNFPELPPGIRLFEVQAQNEDGLWSESTKLPIEIESPWWASWWARSVAILSSLLLVLGMYKYRTNQIKKDAKIQVQMVELERSAMQAQMNPHFIFNCLNSIQNFILQNEKDSAILYLGRFASLIRSVLNASVSGKISLANEIKLLNNYLNLEKLRFKDRFDFEVNTVEGLDINEWDIPPLLIQPYVENAILHGISKRTEGGKVDILIDKKEDFIEVTIKDNGLGFQIEHDNDKKKIGHKSFGMSITKNRLELFSTGKENNLVTTDILYDDNGSIAGTQVVVRIGITE